MNTWSLEEDNLLKLHYETTLATIKEIGLIVNKYFKIVNLRVKELKLKRMDNYMKLVQVHKNKFRKCSLYTKEIIIEISKQYKTREQWKRVDSNSYSTALKMGIIDQCSPIEGIKLNYPQTALFEIIKCLYPNEKVLYNDRKTIYPRELDVFLPSLNIAFEYDGCHFHKNIEEDLYKDSICESKNISLFRIKETNKNNPIPSIIIRLSTFNFNCCAIDTEYIKKQILSKYMDIDDMKRIILNYSNLKDFKRDFKHIYIFLHKNNMKELLNEITRRTYTEKEIITKMKLCKHKSEFVSNYKGMYLQFHRHKDLYTSTAEVYKNLPRKNLI